MGFYVNVKAKQGCSKQINDAWKKQFEGFLIYTPAIIKGEIDYIRNDQSQQHLRYVDSVKVWNKTFPIHASGKGQIFLRAFGYSEERSQEFIKENEELIQKVKFVLDHRMLFSKISGLADAVDALDMNINGEYVENGKLKYYPVPSFENLPQKHQNLVFLRCLEINRPDIWQKYLPIIDKSNINFEEWKDIRNCTVTESALAKNATIWQRCESIAEARDGKNYGLEGRFRDGKVPNKFDLIKAISCDEKEFEEYLNSVSRIKSNNKINTPQKTALLKAV